MKSVCMLKGGKWQDKPHEPQFEVSVDQKIAVGASTKSENGKPTQVSYELANIMVDSGNAKFVEVVEDKRSTPPVEDKKAAERKGK